MLGISLGTIYRWIDTGRLERDVDEEAGRYKERPPVMRKLDLHRAIARRISFRNPCTFPVTKAILSSILCFSTPGLSSFSRRASVRALFLAVRQKPLP